MKAHLIEIRQEANDISSFIFEPEQLIEWNAGQFIRYVLVHKDTDNRGNARYFTIASAPYEKYLQITTRFSNDSSSFKETLRQLPIGGEIQFDEPEGEFVIKDFEKNYIFVVGGIGVTPIRSILAEADQGGERIKAQVLYGTKDQDILFKEQLDGFSGRNPSLVVKYVTDAERDLEEILYVAIHSTDDPYVYITGPEPMVERFTVIAKKLGVDIRHIQTDFFDGYESID